MDRKMLSAVLQLGILAAVLGWREARSEVRAGFRGFYAKYTTEYEYNKGAQQNSDTGGTPSAKACQLVIFDCIPQTIAPALSSSHLSPPTAPTAPTAP